MKLLTREQAQAWCEVYRIPLTTFGLPDVSDRDETFSIPEDAGRRVGLAREQVLAFEGAKELLVWIDDWGVWPSGQWDHIFYQFRKSYGFDSPLIEHPAHHLDSSELPVATSLAVYSLLMLWDCYLISPSGAWLHYSHDECGAMKR